MISLGTKKEIYDMLKDPTIEDRHIWWTIWAERSYHFAEYVKNQVDKEILFEVVRLSKKIETDGQEDQKDNLRLP